MDRFGRGLYAILDLDRLGEREPASLASALLRGGVAAIQLRAKRVGAGSLLATARRVAPLCEAASVPLVLNDRPDVARLVRSWGVHVGQDDLPLSDVRRIAPGTHVGVSTHSLGEVDAAVGERADYLGYGPVFATRTKEASSPVQGLAALSAAARRASVPVVAIGGIDLARATEVAQTGVWAAAAVSAVDEADDPEGLARSFAEAFRKAQT